MHVHFIFKIDNAIEFDLNSLIKDSDTQQKFYLVYAPSSEVNNDSLFD